MLVYLDKFLEDFLIKFVLDQFSLEDGVGLEVHIVLDRLVDLVDLLRLPGQRLFLVDLLLLLFMETLENLVDSEEDLPKDTLDKSGNDVHDCDMAETEEERDVAKVIRGSPAMIESYHRPACFC